VVAVTDHDVGGFDEGPLQVLIAGLAHVTEAVLAPEAWTVGTTPA
jgi:hypothetical protein